MKSRTKKPWETFTTSGLKCIELRKRTLTIKFSTNFRQSRGRSMTEPKVTLGLLEVWEIHRWSCKEQPKMTWMLSLHWVHTQRSTMNRVFIWWMTDLLLARREIVPKLEQVFWENPWMMPHLSFRRRDQGSIKVACLQDQQPRQPDLKITWLSNQ